jgi:hypothetical protein
VHRRDPRQPVQRCLIELALAVGVLGPPLRASLMAV